MLEVLDRIGYFSITIRIPPLLAGQTMNDAERPSGTRPDPPHGGTPASLSKDEAALSTVTHHPAPPATVDTWAQTPEERAAAGERSKLADFLLIIPGYEILGELGHGGMGFVYKARQIKADRVVALKVIKTGTGASDVEIARFRTEAQAVAQVNHPNVVQIHEVGEHEGLPYFSMEFCPGGSLEKKLRDGPLPLREAAALIEKAARGLEAAHRRGVIHRDLKPANILLDDEGTPKVADFGVAKRLDADAGQTHADAVMGTPKYMAPEQAVGDSKSVGPASDIYALGAILYECLTGRAPFKGTSLRETLEQVRTQEPVRPTELNANVPRDLETICLKCLRKESGKRYASAADLADDLKRHLEGQQIVAQPTGLAERTLTWVKRNPVVSGAIVLVVALAALLLATLPRQHTVDVQAAGVTPATTAPGVVKTSSYGGRIDVLVERTDENGKARLLRLNDGGALPLRKDDKFRIEGKVDPPAYLYVLWVDPDHDITPVYPWDAKVGWGSRPAQEELLSKVSLPSNAGKLYTAPQAKPGVATMVLFARSTPLDDSDDVVRGWFEKLPDLTLPTGGDSAAVWFDNYIEVRDPDRPRTFGEVGADDAFARWQGQLQKVLGAKASFQTAVSFARTGGK